MQANRMTRAAAQLAALLVTAAGCNYVSPTDSNPNEVAHASLNQLFIADQVNSFFITEDNISRLAAIWLQQMAGTDRQFSIFDTYVVKEADVSTEWTNRYNGGGLVDLRRAESLADSAQSPVLRGILEVYEAYLVGMTASTWGDIPYSEAVDPAIATPKLDAQQDVYAAVQSLLDDAITKLATGQGSPGSLDLVFGGDAAPWIAVAHTLKARFYMHWVEAQDASMPEAQTACGGNCLQKALAETGLGITSPAGNWHTVHGTSQTETNILVPVHERPLRLHGSGQLHDRPAPVAQRSASGHVLLARCGGRLRGLSTRPEPE